jgi:hypothetical protein
VVADFFTAITGVLGVKGPAEAGGVEVIIENHIKISTPLVTFM